LLEFPTGDGQDVEINDPRMTLTGQRGTLVTRNRIAWNDVADDWAVFTGTWKVIRGTGDYAARAQERSMRSALSCE
jgi:hypothetical protein